MQPGFGRRQEKAVRIVGKPLVVAQDPNKFVYLVVIRFYVIIADGPVISQSVNIPVLKILRAKTE